MRSLQIVTTSSWAFHANINAILLSSRMKLSERKWILTNWDSNLYPIGYTDQDQRIVIEGRDILSILRSDFQLIWGVLSAGNDSITESTSLPFSETNEDVWNPFYKIQNENADFEILVWDSSYTLITSRDESILENIRLSLGENTAFFTDCLKPTREYYRGMTVNEMLSRSGFDQDFYSAKERNDKAKMTSILCSLGIDWNNVRTIVDEGNFA